MGVLNEKRCKMEKKNTKTEFTKIGKNTAQWNTYLHYFICYFVNYKEILHILRRYGARIW